MRHFALTGAVVVALGCLATAALAAGSQPFHGAWSGGPADCDEPFRFEERTYTPPGATPMRIVRVRTDGRSHRITMQGDYTINLTVKGRSMLWQSEASGDFFELKRCR